MMNAFKRLEALEKLTEINTTTKPGNTVKPEMDRAAILEEGNDYAEVNSD